MSMEKEGMLISVPGDGKVHELKTAEAFTRFLKEAGSHIQLTDNEAEMILNYFEGHDYIIGESEGRMLRGDLAEQEGKIIWEEYSIDDVIDRVCEWNYELILEADAKRRNPSDFMNYANSQSYYESLKVDEIVLDKLFEQTTHYEQIEMIANRLADEYISKLQGDTKKDEELNAVIEDIASQLSSYGRERMSR